MFWLMVAMLFVAIVFSFFLVILYLMDRNAREVINHLPQPGQASNVQGHGLRFPTGDNQ